MEKITCKNCQTIFAGIFCPNCGEKVLVENDFTISKIVGQAFSSITNFDSKIYKSLKLLFFYPGELSKKYVQGIRVPFMKPFQLFIIANIVFFIFLSDIDIFRTPSKWYFQENFDGINVMNQVRAVASKKNITESEVAFLFDSLSSTISKSFLFLLIPCIALICMLLHLQKKMPFGKHIIFATHYFSFILLIMVLWTQLINLINFEVNRWIFIIPIFILMFIYLVFAFKRFFEAKFLNAFLKGIVTVIVVIYFFQLYKVGVNILTFYFI